MASSDQNEQVADAREGAYVPALCSRLTTETGSIVELWETEHGFELLFAEAHRPDEVVHAVELRLIEVESLAGSMAVAVAAVEADRG